MTVARFAGRRAFVTGGAKGIGAAIVRRLRDEGADVVFCDIDEGAGGVLADATGARFVPLDLSSIDAIAPAVSGAGPFAILVSNAGIDQHNFFTDTGPQEWRALLRLNLEAGFAAAHAVLPAMQTAGWGRLVFVGSEAGRLGSRGGAVYAAAKSGLVGFAKSLARENARFGITVNVVAPGPIRTPLLEAAIAAHGGDRLLAAMCDATLVRRLGEPEEVAAAVAFLASDEAGFITGEVLGVSGGMGIGAG